MSDSSRPHGLQPTRTLCPWDFPGKSTGVGCHRLLHPFMESTTFEVSQQSLEDSVENQHQRERRMSLVGCSPGGHEESDTTEQLHFHFLLSCDGEGNGNPLQCSCLENPRDGGAWWAAVYGVAQSRTRLKRLSSSSSKGVFRAQSH